MDRAGAGAGVEAFAESVVTEAVCAQIEEVAKKIVIRERVMFLNIADCFG